MHCQCIEFLHLKCLQVVILIHAMLLNKLTNIKHDKLKCVLFSNGLFQLVIFEIPSNALLKNCLSVYAATYHVHLCV